MISVDVCDIQSVVFGVSMFHISIKSLASLCILPLFPRLLILFLTLTTYTFNNNFIWTSNAFEWKQGLRYAFFIHCNYNHVLHILFWWYEVAKLTGSVSMYWCCVLDINIMWRGFIYSYTGEIDMQRASDRHGGLEVERFPRMWKVGVQIPTVTNLNH